MTVPNNANVYLAPVIAIPSALQITNITQSNPMVVTVSANSDQVNTYIPGQLVKMNVPVTFGMWQANGITREITAVLGNLITLDVDSTGFDGFNPPLPGILQPATLCPAGSRNLQFSNNTAQIPFQSLTNRGN